MQLKTLGKGTHQYTSRRSVPIVEEEDDFQEETRRLCEDCYIDTEGINQPSGGMKGAR